MRRSILLEVIDHGLTEKQFSACNHVLIQKKTYRQASRSLRTTPNAIGQRIAAARRTCTELNKAFPARRKGALGS